VKQWVEVAGSGDDASTARLARALSIHPLAARVLATRGLADPAEAARFLSPRLEDLPDPFTMKGMEAAVGRLVRAVEGGEPIACYGDYDVDGVTSTTLLSSFLRAAGGLVSTYVPHRLVEGYGLNAAAVQRLAGEGVRLIVTLDCGITSVAEVAEAARLGVDVVVVDHHTVPIELPAAAAILNPHQTGCGYPSKHLAAVGVTFNLALALRRRLRERGRFGPSRPEPNLRESLDLVALGTVADVVPLVEVNRLLVRFGLAELGKARRPGIRALLRVAGVATGDVTAAQVGFRLGPRINAAGRLDDAGRGVRLLSTSDPGTADALAEELDRENRARQEIERQILEEALADAAERVAAGARGLVLSRPGWHPGVVGIVASRVVERFHRPAVLVGVADGVGRGSGRSIERFHLHEALSACSGSLSRFGGHRHAAGVTLDPGAIPAFREAFERHAASVLRDEDLVPRTRIEGWVHGDMLDERAAVDLERLAPFGAGNPEPVFALRVRPSRARQVGAAGIHLKLVLADRDAIAFQLGDRLSLCSGLVEAAVSVGFDDWDGMRRLQLRVRDLRAAEEAPRPSAASRIAP
jgi:single-stranded-DNA-specific exonuclease